jgi:two-component system sensor histidine kinase MprB
MSFRRRMVLLTAGAVAAAVVLASGAVYVLTRNELLGQIDASLRAKVTPGQPQAVQIRSALTPAEREKLERAGVLPGDVSVQGGFSASGHSASGLSPSGPGAPALGITPHTVHRVDSGPLPPPLVLPAPALGGAIGYVQLYRSNGSVLRSEEKGLTLPIDAATRAVATGQRDAFYSESVIAGTKVRMFTARAPEGGVWQVALPLTDVNSTLARLRLVLALVCLGGVALAAALGLLVSRGALIPVRRLTAAAERVARTQDLGHRIRAGEGHELGRLAGSFNTMLAALERSRLAQRQLVSDASHELRTPLTSVRANLDALALGERLSAPERRRILGAVQAQLGELTVLVGDLVDLSKTEVDAIEVEDVRLDLAAAEAIQRTRLHAPDCGIALDAEPCLVRAAPARLHRAIANLLDNACKWNAQPSGSAMPGGVGSGSAMPGGVGSGSATPGPPVEVRVRDGVLSVRDHGPGIAAEDLPRVFDRFFRAPAARARPGSGLGLAIVRQVAEAHGGAVYAANDPNGGARLTLELPPVAMTRAELGAAARETSARAGSVQVQETPPLL